MPYENLYKNFDAHPELSLHEANTPSTRAGQECLSSYKIHVFFNGHGLAGVLNNGSGPTVLLRAYMDALAVEEKTGPEYTNMKDL